MAATKIIEFKQHMEHQLLAQQHAMHHGYHHNAQPHHLPQPIASASQATNQSGAGGAHYQQLQPHPPAPNSTVAGGGHNAGAVDKSNAAAVAVAASNAPRNKGHPYYVEGGVATPPPAAHKQHPHLVVQTHQAQAIAAAAAAAAVAKSHQTPSAVPVGLATPPRSPQLTPSGTPPGVSHHSNQHGPTPAKYSPIQNGNIVRKASQDPPPLNIHELKTLPSGQSGQAPPPHPQHPQHPHSHHPHPSVSVSESKLRHDTGGAIAEVVHAMPPVRNLLKPGMPGMNNGAIEPMSPTGFAADLTYKFQARHYLNVLDHLEDGFFDGGRGPGPLNDIYRFASALELSKSTREILVIDVMNDPGLQSCVKGAQAMLRNVPDLLVRIQLLAFYVCNGFGGSIPAKDLQVACDALMAKLKLQNGSRILRLGQLWGAYGLGRHRALLFKYLCDQTCLHPKSWLYMDSKSNGGGAAPGAIISAAAAAAVAVPPTAVSGTSASAVAAPTAEPFTPGRIECGLFRGESNSTARAWNEVRVPASDTYRAGTIILDLMKPDGCFKFIPSDSADGTKYKRFTPDGKFGLDAKPLPREEPLYVPFSELTELRPLKKEDQGAQSVVSTAIWRGKRVIVKQKLPPPPPPNGKGKFSERAIKMAQEDERFSLLQFESERKTLSEFRHPNVVPLLAAVETPFSLVLEHVSDGDLYNVVRLHMAWSERLKLLIQIASGLAAMHAAGIVHRDLKPANLLWDSTKQLVKICDLGLARYTTVRGCLETAHPHYGTLPFMAAEQMYHRILTDKVDVYGFAGIIWWFACGGTHHPWDDMADDPGWRTHTPGAQCRNDKIMNSVKQGYMPLLPEGFTLTNSESHSATLHATDRVIPLALKRLMDDCFHPVPKERPTMVAVLQKLMEIAKPFGALSLPQPQHK